ARAQGATVIDPVIDVHDALTVDPGLIAIASDYGWMRAHDVMRNVSQKHQQLTHDIIDMRRHLWVIEDHLFGPGDEEADHEAELQRLGELKLQLRGLIDAARPSQLPPGAEQWWRGWEQHPYAIDQAPTWVAD